jgi:hypothetical protein
MTRKLSSLRNAMFIAIIFCAVLPASRHHQFAMSEIKVLRTRRVRFVGHVAHGIGCGTIHREFPPDIAKEQFAYPASQSLFKKLEQLSHRSGVSRGVAFEDWLTAMVCVLAAETKEGEYLAMVERHKAGKQGKRGVDVMGQMFGELVNAMTDSDSDILGDLFQGSITYGEAGQYFTPESITKLLAQMSIDPDARPADGRPILINDPLCCPQHKQSSVAQAVM